MGEAFHGDIMTEAKSFIERVGGMKDEVVADITHELLTNPRFAKALGSAVKRATKTKEKLDRNVSLLISLSGIPSKNDYDRLSERAGSLAGSIARIEERIDDLVIRLEKLSAEIAGR
jgi:hypothetical protein